MQPFGALMYRINDHFSWYVSYADIYRAQFDDYLKSDGNPIGPQHGVTVESGIKGAWREGALNGSLAVYRTEQQGVPISTGAQSNLRFCCVRSGTALSRGVELDLDGELAPGWLIGSGYAYNLYATGTSEYVLDKRYYLSEDTPIQTFWYGDPRNFMLRIDAKY